MLAIFIILVFVGLYAYYAYSECEEFGITIVICFFIVFVVSFLFFLIPCFFATTYEYTISYDDYSIDDDALYGYTIYYFDNDSLFTITADSVEVFVGEDNGYFLIQEKCFYTPEWFWLIAFFPDDILIRTEVLIV